MKEGIIIKKKKIILLLILAIFIGIFIYSTYQLFSWEKDNKEIEEQVIKAQEVTEIKEVEDTQNTVIVNPPKKKNDPYWDYIKMNLIDVDFKELKKINSEVIGWIQVNGTNINYPFVQTTDNDFYLTHQLNKKKNSAGWVFMDYRNSMIDLNKNTILYAHGRYNNTMFGSLRKVIKKSWYSDSNNHIVKLSTETENTLWQVFSTYKIKTTNDYIQTTFADEEEYSNFLNLLKNRSSYHYNVDVGKEDFILTLSTCYDDNYKVVLHAKLIKREKKEN